MLRILSIAIAVLFVFGQSLHMHAYHDNSNSAELHASEISEDHSEVICPACLCSSSKIKFESKPIQFSDLKFYGFFSFTGGQLIEDQFTGYKLPSRAPPANQSSI